MSFFYSLLLAFLLSPVCALAIQPAPGDTCDFSTLSCLETMYYDSTMTAYTGVAREYDGRTGQLVRIYRFENGLPDGFQYQYYLDESYWDLDHGKYIGPEPMDVFQAEKAQTVGPVWFLFNLENGEFDGKSFEFYEDGRVYKEIVYKNGKLVYEMEMVDE
jgi:antitoxin component YwqK of YwqJK toxin-antitoxin module